MPESIAVYIPGSPTTVPLPVVHIIEPGTEYLEILVPQDVKVETGMCLLEGPASTCVFRIERIEADRPAKNKGFRRVLVQVRCAYPEQHEVRLGLPIVT